MSDHLKYVPGQKIIWFKQKTTTRGSQHWINRHKVEVEFVKFSKTKKKIIIREVTPDGDVEIKIDPSWKEPVRQPILGTTL